jgi:hypothetical protein
MRTACLTSVHESREHSHRYYAAVDLDDLVIVRTLSPVNIAISFRSSRYGHVYSSYKSGQTSTFFKSAMAVSTFVGRHRNYGLNGKHSVARKKYGSSRIQRIVRGLSCATESRALPRHSWVDLSLQTPSYCKVLGLLHRQSGQVTRSSDLL